MVFELAEPGPLLQLLRERVTASVVVQQRVDLERKRGLSVIGRRPPSGGGEVTWAYELDNGRGPGGPRGYGGRGGRAARGAGVPGAVTAASDPFDVRRARELLTCAGRGFRSADPL